MIDRDSPVTEDELHVYVDGELPGDRLAAVERWLSTHPEDAARVAAWRSQADAIRARYSSLVKEPIPERLALDRIMRSGRMWTAIAASVAVLAFLVGGVTGWVARGASTSPPSAFELFTGDALQAHKLYVGEVRHPVEVPGIERQHLVQWLSKRLNYQLRAPNLEENGLKLVGGRLLPGPTGGPAAFFMYEGPSGERFSLYCGTTKSAQTAMRYHGGDNTSAVYWVDGDLAYVMVGPANRDQLLKVAQAAYDQIESRSPSVAEKL
jgi:anti-sigma factor RsiW